jgi:hypothetical protein
MTRWVLDRQRWWAWWSYRVLGRDRLVLLAGLTVRLAALAMIGYVVPLVWAHLRHPGWSLVLAVGLAGETAVVAAWCAARARLVRQALWVDVPFTMLALVAGAALTGGAANWTLFAYPYAILISFCYGLACRTASGALGCGALAAGAGVAGLLAFGASTPAELLLVTPTYLVNPLVGWRCARLLRQASDDLDAARAAAIRETADLATAAQRARLGTALHDRILQTLETLSRGGAVLDEALGERVRRQAAWLRRYIETGRVDQSDDLSVGLDAAARAAVQAGHRVEVNDARLRAADPTGGLSREQRDALVEAVHQSMSAFGAHDGEIVVRAAPDDGGVLVTVLSTGRAMPRADDIADARDRLGSAGGRLILEPAAYVELWMPGQTSPRSNEIAKA